MKKLMTLVMVYNDEKILLALKKRGFGIGRWNGYGGKVIDGESIEDSAKREFEEESGVSAGELKPRGQLKFTFEQGSDELEVHLFSTENFQGEAIETEEMKPQWFLHTEIPYSEMWADDPHWIPQLIEGKNIKAHFHFDAPDTQNIISKRITAEYE